MSDPSVFVVSKTDGGGPTHLHTDPDCSRLAGRAGKIVEKDRSLYPDSTPVCSWCRGDVDRGGGDNTLGPWADLEAMDPSDAGLTARGER